MLIKFMAFAVMEGTDEATFWILGWGAKAQVIEPASLREDIRAEAEEMLEISTRRKKTRGQLNRLFKPRCPGSCRGSVTNKLDKHHNQIGTDRSGRAMDNIFIERLWRSVKYKYKRSKLRINFKIS